MSDLLARVFADSGFIPHGNSFLWQPGLLWLNVVSDVLIALAYLTISFSIIYVMSKRRDLVPTWLGLLFALLILACGATHLFAILTIWHPAYWLQGGAKAVTAAAAIVAAALTWPMTVRVLGLPSTTSLRRANADLREEAGRREEAESLLRVSHAELESRVAQRTAELQQTNRRLEQEILDRERTERALQHSDVLVRRLNEELEQHVAERTTELTATVAELEAFSYSISHDLRAPLRAISGYAAMLREDHASKLGTVGNNLLMRIEANVGRMATLIDGLLAFSRLGRAQPKAGDVDVLEMVNIIVQELQSEPEGRKAHFSIGALPPVRGDATMLRQVWINLLSNAIKFSSQNPEPRIQIAAERHDDSVVFSVRDNGVGFDKKYADKLFEVFNRLHAAHEFPGVGVGLAIVRRIVVRHEGRVWADGTNGDGATFFFSLPT